MPPILSTFRPTPLITAGLMLSLLATGAVAPAVAQTAETAPPETVSPSLPAISTIAVRRQDLVDRIHAAGRVAPVETVQVQPLIEGQPIEALLADVGDRVEAGAPLARLSQTTLELERSQLNAQRAAAVASIAQAEAQQAEAVAARDESRRVADRAERLRGQGTASQATLDEARANALAAEARVTAAAEGLRSAGAQRDLVDAQIADVELRLNRTTVTAPVAGIVAQRNAERGAIATAQGAPMFVLIRDGALELYADVAEQDLYRLEKGQPVSLSAAGLEGTVPGEVRLVEPAVNETTRLGRVRISIAQEGLLRQGQFAEAEIIVARRNTLSLPLSAISLTPAGAGRGPTSQVLRITAENTVESSPVTLGIRDGGMVEITGGLFAGDRVVARAGAFVRPGDRVNPVPLDSGTGN